jgi:hypothetical protein
MLRHFLALKPEREREREHLRERERERGEERRVIMKMGSNHKWDLQ